jgi:hypothetical protein
MSERTMCIACVVTPEGEKHYVTLLTPEQMSSHGLNPEAIVGELSRPLPAGEPITPEVFARNRVFVEFLHAIIARRGPSLPGLIAEARRQGEGWVYLIDQRTGTPDGAVPPEDIIGVFEVRGGEIVPGSYQACPNHRILSPGGFFQLSEDLQAALMEELANV